MELRETPTENKFEVIYDFATASVRMFPAGMADNFEEVFAGDKRIFRCKQPCYVEYVTIAGGSAGEYFPWDGLSG